MPLPVDCPMVFASMPEHFVEDAMELLLFSSRIPRALDGVILVSSMYHLCFAIILNSIPYVLVVNAFAHPSTG